MNTAKLFEPINERQIALNTESVFDPQSSPVENNLKSVVAAKGEATHTMTKRGTLLVENNYEARIVNSSTTATQFLNQNVVQN